MLTLREIEDEMINALLEGHLFPPHMRDNMRILGQTALSKVGSNIESLLYGLSGAVFNKLNKSRIKKKLPEILTERLKDQIDKNSINQIEI